MVPHIFRVIVTFALYHFLLSETYPMLNERKANVNKWLAEKGVDFSAFKILSELLSLPREKK